MSPCSCCSGNKYLQCPDGRAERCLACLQVAPGVQPPCNVSPWIPDGHCWMRVRDGGSPANPLDRVAFIEKTPRVRVQAGKPHRPDWENWLEGPKGSLFDTSGVSRAWCDAKLRELGYTLE